MSDSNRHTDKSDPEWARYGTETGSGKRYIECRHCGRQGIPADADRLAHVDSCLAVRDRRDPEVYYAREGTHIVLRGTEAVDETVQSDKWAKLEEWR
jgi:hypothetical protein